MKKTKKFNLKKALAGAKLTTIGGSIVTDFTFNDNKSHLYPYQAKVNGGRISYTTNGIAYRHKNTNQHDLVMAAKTFKPKAGDKVLVSDNKDDIKVCKHIRTYLFTNSNYHYCLGYFNGNETDINTISNHILNAAIYITSWKYIAEYKEIKRTPTVKTPNENAFEKMVKDVSKCFDVYRSKH